ncbi:MAG: hypothetical protein ABEK17_01755 [Candidatus Aenigmatarchaeota archaeon]
MKNKKGILFSVMAIFLLSPLVLLTISHTETMSGYGEKVGEIVRLKAGFFFLQSIDEDLERGISIVGKRSITSAINYVVSEGETLEYPEGDLEELFKNGTLHGEEVALMNMTTIYNWKNEVKDLSSERGFLVNISFLGLDIGMKDSYNVLFSLNYSLKLTDKNGVFSFTKNYSKNIGVPITGLEDPLFSLNTGGKVSLPIEKSHYDSYVSQLSTGMGGNGFAGGESIITDDISNIQNKDEKILVTSNADTSDVNNFKAIIMEENTTKIEIPYVKNDEVLNTTPNNTRLAVLGNKGEVWNISKLYEVWEEQLYVSGNGPSFLDRLGGKLNNSYPGKGIETFVVKDKLKEWGISTKYKSVVDHVYFSDKSVHNFNIKGMEDSFMVDNETDLNRTHTQIYGLEELKY